MLFTRSYILVSVVCCVLLQFPATRLTAQEPDIPDTTTQVHPLIAEQMRLGREAMERGDFSRAREHFRLVLALDWNNPLAYQWWEAAEKNAAARMHDLLQAGDRYTARGEYAEALINYREALRLDPDRTDIKRRLREVSDKISVRRHLLAGLQGYLAGDYVQMDTALDSALMYEPENATALALRKKATGHSSAGGEQTRLQEDPAMWEVHLAALKKYRAGDYLGAITYWRKILEKYPGNSEVLANIEQARLRLPPDENQESAP
jgi:tetratricopeptide (TPR) repeat protein